MTLLLSGLKVLSHDNIKLITLILTMYEAMYHIVDPRSDRDASVNCYILTVIMTL